MVLNFNTLDYYVNIIAPVAAPVIPLSRIPFSCILWATVRLAAVL